AVAARSAIGQVVGLDARRVERAQVGDALHRIVPAVLGYGDRHTLRRAAQVRVVVTPVVPGQAVAQGRDGLGHGATALGVEKAQAPGLGRLGVCQEVDRRGRAGTEGR